MLKVILSAAAYMLAGVTNTQMQMKRVEAAMQQQVGWGLSEQRRSRVLRRQSSQEPLATEAVMTMCPAARGCLEAATCFPRVVSGEIWRTAGDDTRRASQSEQTCPSLGGGLSAFVGPSPCCKARPSFLFDPRILDRA